MIVGLITSAPGIRLSALSKLNGQISLTPTIPQNSIIDLFGSFPENRSENQHGRHKPACRKAHVDDLQKNFAHCAPPFPMRSIIRWTSSISSPDISRRFVKAAMKAGSEPSKFFRAVLLRHGLRAEKTSALLAIRGQKRYNIYYYFVVFS